MSRDEIPIGISLSGGGFRATLFALGVLYYFVDSGLAKSLRSVVSVSGGSIANALIAQECDLSVVTSEEFEAIVRRVARTIATTGLLWTFPAFLWMLGIVTVCIGTVTGLVLLPTTLLRLCALVMGIVAFGGTFHLRGFALSRAMKQVFFSTRGSPTRLKDLARVRVRHAVVATEMTSGRPIFFESHVAHGPGLRHYYCDSGSIPVHAAVRWSCTVPGLLPPGTLLSKNLWIQDAINSQEPQPPSTFILMDGGVCNNLGTDYFREATAASFGTRRDPIYVAPTVKQWLVVDASGGLGTASERFAKVPFVGEIVNFYRSISILYENTIRPRTELGTPVISIKRLPTHQIQWGASGNASLEQRKRYVQLTEYFEEHFKTHHDEESLYGKLPSITSQVPTTFGRIDEEKIACLLWHGYMSALCVCYTLLGFAPPKSLCARTIYHFRRVVSATPNDIEDPWARVHHRCDLSRNIEWVGDHDA